MAWGRLLKFMRLSRPLNWPFACCEAAVFKMLQDVMSVNLRMDKTEKATTLKPCLHCALFHPDSVTLVLCVWCHTHNKLTESDSGHHLVCTLFQRVDDSSWYSSYLPLPSCIPENITFQTNPIACTLCLCLPPLVCQQFWVQFWRQQSMGFSRKFMQIRRL